MKNYSADEILKALVESYTESIFITDGDGNVIFVNEMGAKNLRSKRELLLGRNVRDLVDEGVYTTSTTLKAIESRQPYIGHISKGRRDATVSHSVPVMDRDGKIQMVVTANMTIEHSKEWEGILNAERVQNERLARELDNLRMQNAATIIMESEASKRLYANIDIIAPTESNIVLLGESGTGKDLTARYIHMNSPRKDAPFISINCAAIPESLLESELFGYEAGAFTGALSKGKMGLFEAANGGTLFLDEIGEMPMGLQSKLLNALEDRSIRKIGGVKNIPIDVRVICATNADLNMLIKESKFREDLYYRLSVFSVNILPLRERVDDIIPLAQHFLDGMNKKNGTHKYFSDQTIHSLKEHSWPGNIRELRNVVERIFVVSYGDALSFVPTPTYGVPAGLYEPSRIVQEKEYDSLKAFVEESERIYIEKIIAGCGGNMTEAAKKLNMDRSALYKKMKKIKACRKTKNM